jgi:hypothetical protein
MIFVGDGRKALFLRNDGDEKSQPEDRAGFRRRKSADP